MVTLEHGGVNVFAICEAYCNEPVAAVKRIATASDASLCQIP